MNAIRYRTNLMLMETLSRNRMIATTHCIGIDSGSYVSYVYLSDHAASMGYNILTIYTGSHCYFSSSGKVGKHPWRRL